MTIPTYAANAVSCLSVKPGERFQALVDEYEQFHLFMREHFGRSSNPPEGGINL